LDAAYKNLPQIYHTNFDMKFSLPTVHIRFSVQYLLFLSVNAGLLGQKLICDPLLNQIDFGFDCTCDTSYSLTSILTGEVNCTYADSVCLENTPLCGVPSLSANFTLFGGSNYAQACFNLDQDILFDNICISGKSDSSNPLTLSECNVHYGDEPCKSCTVCESGREVSFDCTNINVNSIAPKLLFIPGIKIDSCIGAGVILNLNGEADSIGPFIPQS
jgi:hypothetical protein